MLTFVKTCISWVLVQIGLNFADQTEAQEVFNLIKEKSKPKTPKTTGLTVKPLQQQNRMTNQYPTTGRGNDAIVASQEPIQPQKRKFTQFFLDLIVFQAEVHYSDH